MSKFGSSIPPARLIRAAARIDRKQAAALCGVKPAEFGRWERGADVPEGALDALRDLSERPEQGGSFTFVDLFAGIGALRRAFDESGGHCLLTCEWNPFAAETYAANHGLGHAFVGDITKLSAAEVPEHDVLVAGFPCQAFSLAGVSKNNSLGRPHGFSDQARGTLFFDVARIIEARRPRAFFLENVKNLLSHDKGRTFEVIRRTLADELGYSVSWRVMCSSPWVPQKRRRIFIVGFKDGPAFDFDDVLIPDAAPTMASVLHDGTPDPVYAPDGRAAARYTLSDGLWSYLRAYADKHRSKGNGFGYSLVGPGDVARTLSARYGKDGSEILVETPGGNPRKLTPRECARLMGFDSADRKIHIPVSDTRAWEQFGNSVVVPCASAVVAAMIRRLENPAIDVPFRAVNA